MEKRCFEVNVKDKEDYQLCNKYKENLNKKIRQCYDYSNDSRYIGYNERINKTVYRNCMYLLKDDFYITVKELKELKEY